MQRLFLDHNELSPGISAVLSPQVSKYQCAKCTCNFVVPETEPTFVVPETD